MNFQRLYIILGSLFIISAGIIGYAQYTQAKNPNPLARTSEEEGIFKVTEESDIVESNDVTLPADKLAPILKDASIDVNKNYTLVVNIWATWCGPCIREIPALNTLVEKAKGKEIRFVGATSEDKATVNEFWENRKGKLKFDYQVLSSTKISEELPLLYGDVLKKRIQEAIPQHYIIKNNKVVYFHLGGLGPADVIEMSKVLGLN
jgi:thiol-disulfide isomerase/thioredoxin